MLFSFYFRRIGLYGQHETQQLLRPSLLRPEELSMESGIDPGQDYYTQDYYNYDHGYELPQYGSRRKLISPTGPYDEYGEVIVDEDGSYYYSTQESDGEQGRGKRRIKLVLDREYETSSTGEDTLPGTQQNRVATTLNSHANVNGSVYVAQNGSIIRTRRAANTANTQPTNNNLKLPISPVFSSRLAKHFKKLDKMAATLEERIPLSTPRTAADGGCTILRTFQSSGKASTLATSSFSNTEQQQDYECAQHSKLKRVLSLHKHQQHGPRIVQVQPAQGCTGPAAGTDRGEEGGGERGGEGVAGGWE
ncbi:hypothetical protein WMY93_010878 [Mugilogobius chulae]|uniref:Uncharacterized protein n=1 Tax=Mugilogobius chulae TaxID=88201 RepID=A0AAW0PHM2_9GOBI